MFSLDLKINNKEIKIKTGIYIGMMILLYNSFKILSTLSNLQFSTSKFSSISKIFKSKENTNYSRYRILIFLIGLSTIIISEMTIRLIREDFFENIKFFIIPIVLIISLYTIYFVKFRIIR